MAESEPKREYKRDANGKRVGRPRPLPAHVNARNLAIEKQRRQFLNEKFLEIADLIPDFVASPRLNRVIIVNRCLEHMRERRQMCIAAAENVQDILAENYRLKSELNTLRAQTLGPTAPQAGAPVVGEALAQLLKVKDEAVGASTKIDETVTIPTQDTGTTGNKSIASDQTAVFGTDMLSQQTIQQNAFQFNPQVFSGINEPATILDGSFQPRPSVESTQMTWAFNPYINNLNAPVL